MKQTSLQLEVPLESEIYVEIKPANRLLVRASRPVPSSPELFPNSSVSRWSARFARRTFFRPRQEIVVGSLAKTLHT